MPSAGNARKALWIDTLFAIFPFLIYLISFLCFVPRSAEKLDWTIYPNIFYYISLLYIAGTLVFVLFKQFQRDSFYIWLSFSIYFSLSTIISQFNPFHLLSEYAPQNYYGIMSINRAWAVVSASVLVLFLLRKKLLLRPNRLIYAVAVYLFCLSHNMLYTMDLLSFGGVHVDFYDPFPWIHQIMIPTICIFTLFVIFLSTLKRKSLRLLFSILLFLVHALAWNQSRFASIQYYTKELNLIRSAGAYMFMVLVEHIELFILKSWSFLFLLLLIPEKKKPLPPAGC